MGGNRPACDPLTSAASHALGEQDSAAGTGLEPTAAGPAANSPVPTDPHRDGADPQVDVLLEHFESLTRTLLRATTVAETLAHIVDAAMRVVPGSDLVSVTLRSPNGAFYTPVETGSVATELDQVQYAAQQGPCLEATLLDGPGYVSSDDLRSETRWPQFAAAAVEHGYASILSTELLPVTGRHHLAGALNIYSHRHGGLTQADRHAALLLATHGSLALAHARTAELAALQESHLTHAIDTRDVIGQAKGILMSRQGITADEAFDVLRRTSQDLNVKLVDLANTLTARHNELNQP